MYEKLKNQEFIKIYQYQMTDEMKQYFPYESDIKLSSLDMMSGIKIYCKEPQTAQQHHDHYMKQAETYSETADDYLKKAKYFKEQARKALKGEF